MIEIKKYLNNKKGFRADIFLMFKKMTALSCVAGLITIVNLPLFDAYEAHTVNITAKIVNDIPCIDPPGGEFCSDGELKVELSVTLAEAEIYYTVDGTNPVCGLTNKYYIPFSIPDGLVTVKAVACHEELRNGALVVIQSAVMTKEFNSSLPNVTVTSPVDGALWYCFRTYPIEWTVENYKGSVNDLTVDIVYIVDKDRNGVISAGDDNHLVAENLPTKDIGSYLFKVDYDKGYCFTGYSWAKVIVTEPNNCSGFGISGRIYEPMPSNDSVSIVSNTISIIPEIEPIIPEESTIIEDSDISDDGEVVLDNDSADVVDNIGEDIEGEDIEDSVNENLETDDKTDTNNVADEMGEDIRNEDSEEINNDTEDDLIIDDEDDTLNLDESNEDKENLTTGEEENILDEEGVIMDREEDFEEEVDNSEDNKDDDINEDNPLIVNDNIVNNSDDDTVLDNDVDDDIEDSSDNDDISVPELPIESDADSTEIIFNL